MLEKIFHKAPTIVATSSIFTFIFYMGSRIANGESMGGSRGIMRMVAGMFNFVTDTFGAVQTGYAIMGLAIFGAVTAAIKVWHSPNF